MYKWLVGAIKCINYITKRKKAVKGLKFRDRQNNIDHAISTGVEYESSGSIILSEYTGNLDDIV